MRYKKHIAILIISVIGMLLSLYASILTIEVRHSPNTVQSLCNINALFDCNYVAASEYALFLGVPIAWGAFTYYLWICSVVFLTIFSRVDQKPSLIVALLISTLAAAFSIYKGWQMIFQLKIVCLICMLMYLANAAIALLLIKLSGLKLKSNLVNYATPHQGTEEKSLKHNILTYFPALFSVIVVFLTGYFVIHFSFLVKGVNRIESPLPHNNSISNSNLPDDALAHHFAQTKQKLVLAADAPMWGNTTAPITVVEFSDFQCPFCQIAAAHLKDILAAFKDQVKLYFIHYPLDKSVNPDITEGGHKYAGLAARAAMYAYDQGKFWQFHDDLFQRQPELDNNTVLSIAKSYGWNINQFQTALSSTDMFSRVKKHIKCGKDIDIQGTPSIYINGRLVQQWQDTVVLRAIIQQEMQHSLRTVNANKK